jgi:hypothetical protein
VFSDLRKNDFVILNVSNIIFSNFPTIFVLLIYNFSFTSSRAAWSSSKRRSSLVIANIFLLTAIITQCPNYFSQCIVVGGNCTGIAPKLQDFTDEKLKPAA